MNLPYNGKRAFFVSANKRGSQSTLKGRIAPCKECPTGHSGMMVHPTWEEADSYRQWAQQFNRSRGVIYEVELSGTWDTDIEFMGTHDTQEDPKGLAKTVTGLPEHPAPTRFLDQYDLCIDAKVIGIVPENS